MSGGYVVVDIETISNAFTRPVCDHNGLIGHTTDDRIPAAPHHEIVCIGWMTLSAGGIAENVGCIPGDDEHDKLRNIFSALERGRRTIVSWAGRHFDLPVLTMRALKHGHRIPWLTGDRAVNYRYGIDGHWDLCDWLSGFGAARFAKLEDVSRLLGFPGKLGTHEATGAELEAYCLGDVACTAAILLRCLYMRGTIGDFAPPARALFELIDRTPALAKFSPLIDRARFAMAPGWPPSSSALPDP